MAEQSAVYPYYPLRTIRLGQPAWRTVHLTSTLAAIAAISGLAFRNQGIRFRRSFLEHGLVGELAARDGLTGLKNRRGFDEHLMGVWKQGMRDRKPLALMLIDVDFFKRFNDRYGHQAGDAALQGIAAVVNGYAKRGLDMAARYGGEELALILYDATHEPAQRVADALREAILALGIEHLDGTVCQRVTVSIGVAVVRPSRSRSPEGLVQLADEALYAAKDHGRNRAEVYESEYDLLSTGSFQKSAIQ